VSFAASLSLALALLAPAQVPAPADPAPTRPAAGERPPPVEIVDVRFGWDGTMPAERWAPVVVMVTSEAPFAGVLTLEHPQDATQSVLVVVPFSTTPGRVTPVEAVCAFPASCHRLVLTLTDGRRTVRRTYGPGFGGEFPLPGIDNARGVKCLLVGETTADEAFRDSQAGAPAPVPPEPSKPPEPPSEGSAQPAIPAPTPLWDSFSKTTIEPDRLPTGWMSYEGIDVLVASADALAAAPPRAIAAIRDWVDAGGRLFLQTGGAGAAWRRFLPDGPAGDLVALRDTRRVRAGEPVRALGGDGEFSARTIAATELGIASGWTTRWAVEGDDLSGLIASGPVGLGMVTLIDADPARMAATLDAVKTRRLWRDALESAAPARVRGLAADPNPWHGDGSGADPEASRALAAALDGVSDVPPLGWGVFAAIAASMLALVVMLGPVDGLLLRRRGLGRRSWATALLWIGLAAAAGYAVPALMRSGVTSLHRFAVVDTVCDADGRPTRVWSTGITGLFAGRAMGVALEGFGPGSWLRGVSSAPWYDSTRASFAPVTTPWRTADASPSRRTLLPEPIAVGQWTFRTFLEQTPGRDARPGDIGAMVEREGDGFSVTLLGMPEAAVISTARLFTKGASWELPLATATRTGPRWTFVASPIVPADRLAGPLPVVRDRTETIDAMITAGWSLVEVEVEGLGPEVGAPEVPRLDSKRRCVLRLVTPTPAPAATSETSSDGTDDPANDDEEPR